MGRRLRLACGSRTLSADVLSGDLRLFYLLWLTFAEFFNIDRDLVQAATGRSMEFRMAGALRMRAREIGKARERTAVKRREAERRRQAEEVERARRARLKALERRGESVWRQIEEEIGRRNASGYDRTASLLSDL